MPFVKLTLKFEIQCLPSCRKSGWNGHGTSTKTCRRTCLASLVKELPCDLKCSGEPAVSYDCYEHWAPSLPQNLGQCTAGTGIQPYMDLPRHAEFEFAIDFHLTHICRFRNTPLSRSSPFSILSSLHLCWFWLKDESAENGVVASRSINVFFSEICFRGFWILS